MIAAQTPEIVIRSYFYHGQKLSAANQVEMVTRQQLPRWLKIFGSNQPDLERFDDSGHASTIGWWAKKQEPQWSDFQLAPWFSLESHFLEHRQFHFRRLAPFPLSLMTRLPEDCLKTLRHSTYMSQAHLAKFARFLNTINKVDNQEQPFLNLSIRWEKMGWSSSVSF